MNRRQQLAWESRWAKPTAAATFAAIGLLIASVLVASSVGGGGQAASLRDLHDHSSTVILVSVLQGAGFLLLVAPLVYLFRAAAGRSDRVRTQFLPLIVLAPIALGASAIVNGVSANQAADAFAKGEGTASLTKAEATEECAEERKEDASGFAGEFGGGKGAITACASEKIEDDRAEDAIEGVSLRRVGEGIQFGGLIALAFALIYGCLYAMRAGLLTRFWGSLGIAFGAASVFGLFQFSVIWFIYFGLLVAGWLPRGRPPAWESGEAIPWPTPGERAAKELEVPDDDAPPGPDQEDETQTRE
jgi:hypothetical protein